MRDHGRRASATASRPNGRTKKSSSIAPCRTSLVQRSERPSHPTKSAERPRERPELAHAPVVAGELPRERDRRHGDDRVERQQQVRLGRADVHRDACRARTQASQARAATARAARPTRRRRAASGRRRPRRRARGGGRAARDRRQRRRSRSPRRRAQRCRRSRRGATISSGERRVRRPRRGSGPRRCSPTTTAQSRRVPGGEHVEPVDAGRLRRPETQRAGRARPSARALPADIGASVETRNEEAPAGLRRRRVAASTT